MPLLSWAALCAVLVLAACSADAVDYTGAWGNTTAEQDLVTSLPGVGNLTFPLYAGYVAVDEIAGRALYYTFTPAKTNPDTAPLLLWLNGGPGCSSIGNGFAEEHGPFLPNGSQSVRPNVYSWNNFASVIYVDSPAFVGFSYSLTPQDAVVDDVRTTSDTYLFLVQWFKRFPAYAAREFYITGESYAGRYVPQAALAVVEGNKNVPAAERIKLVGAAIGNGVTDPQYDNLGLIDFMRSHAVISDETHDGLIANCDLSTRPLRDSKGSSCPEPFKKERRCCVYWSEKSGFEDYTDYEASHTTNVIHSGGEVGDINQYQIFSEWPCPAGVALAYNPAAANASEEAPMKRRVLHRGQSQMAMQEPLLAKLASKGLRAANKRRSLLMAGSEPYTYNMRFPVECMDPDVGTFYNRPDVQMAMHANQTNIIPYRFDTCYSAPIINYTAGNNSMLPIYKTLIASGVKMLVFSGDMDGSVPVTGTRYAITALKLKVLAAWAPWYSCSGNVGGRRIRYNGLDLFTVRGSGHEVPWYQAERGTFMMKLWLGIKINCATRCATCTAPE